MKNTSESDFTAIDKEIEKQLNLLKEKIENIQFQKVCEFKLNEEKINTFLDGLNYHGVYLLEVKNEGGHKNFNSWFNNFEKFWNNEEYIKKKSPKIIKSRVKMHKDLKDWIPIYIGKSKEVGKRLKEHIFLELNKTTYALKLKERTNLNNFTFRIQTIRVDVKNYDTIMPVVESELRNKICPIIGKQ